MQMFTLLIELLIIVVTNAKVDGSSMLNIHPEVEYRNMVKGVKSPSEYMQKVNDVVIDLAANEEDLEYDYSVVLDEMETNLQYAIFLMGYAASQNNIIMPEGLVEYQDRTLFDVRETVRNNRVDELRVFVNNYPQVYCFYKARLKQNSFHYSGNVKC